MSLGFKAKIVKANAGSFFNMFTVPNDTSYHRFTFSPAIPTDEKPLVLAGSTYQSAKLDTLTNTGCLIKYAESGDQYNNRNFIVLSLKNVKNYQFIPYSNSLGSEIALNFKFTDISKALILFNTDCGVAYSIVQNNNYSSIKLYDPFSRYSGYLQVFEFN